MQINQKCPSSILASHIKDDLDGKIDMLFDGRKVGIKLESTIVDLLANKILMILRLGYIAQEMREKVIEKVYVDKTIMDK